MEIAISQSADGRTLVALVGRLDTITAPEFEDAVTKLVTSGKRDLLVDLDKIDFVSSAGLRVIMAAQKRLMHDGSIAFRNVQSNVMDVFDMTGFSKLMTFE